MKLLDMNLTQQLKHHYPIKMRLDLERIDDKNIKVLSKNTGRHAGDIILSGMNDWVFRPNDCGCVWTVETLSELTEILINMNKK